MGWVKGQSGHRVFDLSLEFQSTCVDRLELAAPFCHILSSLETGTGFDSCIWIVGAPRSMCFASLISVIATSTYSQYKGVGKNMSKTSVRCFAAPSCKAAFEHDPRPSVSDISL